MLVLWMACVSSSPRAGLVDPGSGSDTGASTAALPAGWSRLRVDGPGLGKVASDGTTTWAVGWDLGLVRAGRPWEALEGSAGTRHSMYDADARDGVLWALTEGQLQRLEEGSWSALALPDSFRNARSMTVRADGTVAVLSSTQGPVGFCDDPCLPSAVNTLGIWDGVGWVVHIRGPARPLDDLVETASGELVAVGSDGWLARWEGTDWADLHFIEDGSLRAVAAHGDEIVAVGSRGLAVRGPLDALSVETLGSDELYAVDIGEDGTIWALGTSSAWTFDGSWTEVALPAGGDWSDIEASEDGAILAGDWAGPTALVGGSAGWEVAWRQPALYDVQDLWLDPTGALWLGAMLGIGRWDGVAFETWESPHPERGAQREVYALSGSGPDDIVAVGLSGVMEWNGAGFEIVSSGDQVWDVSVAPDGTAFVGGRSAAGQALLLRRDDGVWSVDPTPIPPAARALTALQAFAADDVYALTWDEPVALLHFDGASWTELVSGFGEGHDVLWGRSGADLYIGKGGRGSGPSLLRWDGAALTKVPGAPPYVTSLSGNDTALIAGGTEGWGDELAPLVWVWQDGAWTELARGDEQMVVGALGDTVVWADASEVVRGPLSSWLSAR